MGKVSEEEVLEDTVEIVENWLNYRGHDNRTPGMSVAIAVDKDVVYRRDFGYADLDSEEELDDHSFRIASLSKMFTALTLVKLREEDAISLDDKLSDHLEQIPSEIGDIRIKHIMMHCSGLARDGTTDYWNTGNFPSEQELREYRQPPVKKPLEHWKYSNLGYGLLGQIIEQVSDQSYTEAVEEKVLNPLGMNDTEVDPENRGDLATGYGNYRPLTQREVMEDCPTNALASATGLVSTAEDIAKFAASTFGNDFIVEEADLKELLKTHWDMETGEKWGLGFKNMEVADREVYGHSGGFPGHYSSIGICPEDQVAVVVMGNTIDLEIEKIMKSILHTFLKTKDLYPEFREEIERQEKFVGTYADRWGETEVKKLNNGLVMYPASTKPLENHLKIVEEDGDLKLEGGTGYGYTGEKVQISEDGETLTVAAKKCEQIEHFELGESALQDWKN
jgi:D-alanyl-D-alanine carboxypeptidase